jgi:hypothetical protein
MAEEVTMPVNSTASAEPGRAKPSIGALVEGLVFDIRTLIAQELRLARHEIRQEVSKVRTAAVGAAIGLSLAIVAALLLLLMLVHVLHEVAGLPLWASYGIVAGVLLAGAVAFLLRARSAASGIHLVPEKTVSTVKENLTWLKEQATSLRT